MSISHPSPPAPLQNTSIRDLTSRQAAHTSRCDVLAPCSAQDICMLTDRTFEVSRLLIVSSPGTHSGSEVGPGLFKKLSRYVLPSCQPSSPDTGAARILPSLSRCSYAIRHRGHDERASRSGQVDLRTLMLTLTWRLGEPRS